MCPLGDFFIDFQLGPIDFFPLLVLQIFLARSVVDTLIHLSLTLSILGILSINRPLNISIISKSKKVLVQNPYRYYLLLTFTLLSNLSIVALLISSFRFETPILVAGLIPFHIRSIIVGP